MQTLGELLVYACDPKIHEVTLVCFDFKTDQPKANSPKALAVRPDKNIHEEERRIP
jgi:hypothetical protein